LESMRRISDDINNLGLSPAEAELSNIDWTVAVTPDDQSLVNDAGDFDSHWLINVLHDVPAR